MSDDKKETTFVTTELLWAYFAIGVFVLVLLLGLIWGDGGFMVDEYAFERILTVVFAVIFGFGLGWLLYPRRFHWPFKD